MGRFVNGKYIPTYEELLETCIYQTGKRILSSEIEDILLDIEGEIFVHPDDNFFSDYLSLPNIDTDNLEKVQKEIEDYYTNYLMTKDISKYECGMNLTEKEWKVYKQIKEFTLSKEANFGIELSGSECEILVSAFEKAYKDRDISHDISLQEHVNETWKEAENEDMEQEL